MQTNKLNDPTLEELWAIRRDLSLETPASAEQRFAYYARRQRQRGARLFQRKEETAPLIPQHR